jgi:hypothetical protein
MPWRRGGFCIFFAVRKTKSFLSAHWHSMLSDGEVEDGRRTRPVHAQVHPREGFASMVVD